MRIRAEYMVGPDLKFISNLDMMRLMGRALRRAKINYALSEGFNPHIKLYMGTVLPVGLWGEKEYFDLELREDHTCEDIVQRINRVLPPAIIVKECIEIPAKTPALMKLINAASYVFTFQNNIKGLLEVKDKLINSQEIIVKSRGKKKDIDKDLRKGIYSINYAQYKNNETLEFWVSVGEPVNVRYDELFQALWQEGIEKSELLEVYRSGNYYKEGEQFFSPLILGN